MIKRLIYKFQFAWMALQMQVRARHELEENNA